MKTEKVVAFRRNSSNGGWWILTESGDEVTIGQSDTCPTEVVVKSKVINGKRVKIGYQMVSAE